MFLLLPIIAVLGAAPISPELEQILFEQENPLKPGKDFFDYTLKERDCSPYTGDIHRFEQAPQVVFIFDGLTDYEPRDAALAKAGLNVEFESMMEVISELQLHPFIYLQPSSFNMLSALVLQDQLSINQLPQTDWYYYSQDEWFKHGTSKALRCVDQIYQEVFYSESGERQYPSISAVGRSNGGDALLDFAKKLEKKGVAIDLAITVDPVPRGHELVFDVLTLGLAKPLLLKSPKNLRRPLMNYYQRDDRTIGFTGVRGNKVAGENVINTRVFVESSAYPFILSSLQQDPELIGTKRQALAKKVSKKWADHGHLSIIDLVREDVFSMIQSVPSGREDWRY